MVVIALIPKYRYASINWTGRSSESVCSIEISGLTDSKKIEIKGGGKRKIHLKHG